MSKTTKPNGADASAQTVARKILIRVPATASNIGPGFDTLGLALNLYNDYIFGLAEGTQGNEVHVSGALQKKKLHQPLFEQALEAITKRAGSKLPPVQVEIRGDIPPGVGLGASAATRVATLLAANLWLGSPFSQEALLALAIELEGHPDNATPAMYGGLTVTMLDEAGPLVNIHKTHPEWRFVFMVPGYSTDTGKSRKELPKKIAREDAVHNLSRLPILIEALVSGVADGLGRVVSDRLHEPVRAEGIKRFKKMRSAALEAGAAGVFISGSGPALGAICHGASTAEKVALALADAMKSTKLDTQTFILEAVQSGTRIAEMD